MILCNVLLSSKILPLTRMLPLIVKTFLFGAPEAIKSIKSIESLTSLKLSYPIPTKVLSSESDS